MIVQQRDARWWHGLNAASRFAIWNGAAPWATYPAINEYPKSGGSWLSQLMAEMFDLPNPRNRLPLLKSSILHGHYLNLPNPKDLVIVWRDGRDVAVSFYHHLLLKNNFATGSAQRHVAGLMGDIDVADTRAGMPRFIELMATGQITPGFGWQAFVEKWHGHAAVRAETRYEDMLTDCAAEIARIADAFALPLSTERAQAIAEKYSFQNQTKRKPGEEDKASFLRKGIAGDWENHFTAEARAMFDHHCGDALITLGYEADRSWVEKA